MEKKITIFYLMTLCVTQLNELPITHLLSATVILTMTSVKDFQLFEYIWGMLNGEM